MSQPNNNYPSFSFNEPYYEPEPSQSINNASYSQWDSQDSRSIGNNVPSPSPSIRTARSAPIARPANVIGFSHSNVLQREPSIDPSLSNLPFLAVPQAPRPGPSLDNADPIARFYSEDSPWSSEQMRNTKVSFSRSSFSQPSMQFPQYQTGPRSEIESLPAPRSDSGYHTLPSQSLVGNEPDRLPQDLPSDVTFRIRNMNVSSASSEPVEMFRVTSSVTDQASQYSGRSTTRSAFTAKEIKCTECKEVSKCKSDHKKHMLRHNKPFKCNIPNCRRGTKGFTTINDLNRHKKSVHRIRALENSYQCASDNCRNKEKIWPRLDNFKQHIHRMHKDEDELDLIRRSAYQVQESTPTTESLSVAPMDTTLAGIGTEKQFSNTSNELDDPVPGISLTPDQETNQWTSFGPSTREFAMDVDQTNTSLFNHSSRKTIASSIYKAPESGLPQPFKANSPLARRMSFERLTALADAASSQAAPSKPVQPSSQLSTAPQTKADQQKVALQKFSRILVRDIQNASSNNPKDLENVIMRVLSSSIVRKESSTSRQSNQASSQTSNQGPSTSHDTSDSTEMNALTKKEALKATQAMSELIKKAPSARRQPSLAFSVNMRKCEHCTVTVARPCDMRKHMKRHTRPYGCTYPKCHKHFGAKSDWKRHENSQHFQLESFRCQLTSPSLQTPCGELFYRAENFKSHLADEHKMTEPEQVEHEVKMRRIGKNGQGQFWCGFCQRIVRLEKKRNAAWDERFDHIDNHFSKEGKKIEEWLCVEAKKTKAEVQKEVERYYFDDEDTDGSNPDDDDTNPTGTRHDSQGAHNPASVANAPPSASTSKLIPRKRSAESDQPDSEPGQKRNKREVWRYCCSCESGPWATHTFLNCMDCQHQWCDNCATAVMGLE